MDFEEDNIPPQLDLKIQSSIYPTYKSVKPITFATQNFLGWLKTQPPGPVILLGHSMGGLLAAQAATDPSNGQDGNKRIVGMIAFDCPYLGMHPHVVITGIASLIPKKDRKETDHDQNGTVQVVYPQIDSRHDLNRNHLPHPNHSTPDSLIGRTMKFVSSHSDDPLVLWARKHSDEPFNAGKRWVVEHFQFGSCMFDPNRQDFLHDNNEALVESGITNSSDGPSSLVGSENESDSLYLSAPSRSSTPEVPIFGPKTKSQAKGDAKVAEKERKLEEKKQRNIEKEHKKEQKALQKERAAAAKAAAKDKDKNKVKTGRHFVVLPTGLGAILGGGDNWEKVVIEGVKDEVAAHCGLFIPGQNLDYEHLVQRVGFRVMEWCNKV
ncbi:hypothetical protein BT96DRAFT_936980 [Gymnopus androsaceus JB14]|uniref:Uncharacterized protein n=1 Tax=Gymnopus androsaceus JB14 TaxID=1447944 RepID=A0A6A4HY91_9AGAR|nr:hypothetical protein BT96DRAFT_936980 [Gymnopus androsaceus JB14]